MQIEKIIIYGFGKHENVTISLDSGMNVLYGSNEAGKTTIQQFILHILFGFPQRNSTALRYEPKSGGKYGGQLVLRDDNYGECIVERIRGKSAGDVTVYFEDGTSGGEESLHLLLNQYDRTSFESIFSFSLLQLQGFEKMDEEELSRTLLASGTTGVDSLLQVEKDMEKELNALFKKSGRNPEINTKIKELQQLDTTLKEAQDTIAKYEPTLKRVQEIQEELTFLEAQVKKKKNNYQQLSLLRQYLPIHEKEIELKKKMNRIKQHSFPTDGIRRFESIAGKLSEAKASRQRLKEELTNLTARLADVDEREKLTAIELLLAKESEWHGWIAQSTFLESERTRLVSSKHRLFDRLGMKIQQEEVLLTADVSIRKEEEMFEVLNEIKEIDKQIAFVQSHVHAEETELKEVQLKLETITAPTISEMERAKAWPKIRQQLAEAKAYTALGKENRKESKAIPIILIVFSLICIGFGVIQQQWLVALAGILFGVISFFLFKSTETSIDDQNEKQKAFISKFEGQEFEMEELLSRINAYTYEKHQLEQQIERNVAKLENYSIELTKLKSQSEQANLSFEHFIHSYGFDGLPSLQIVPQLFRMIRTIQEVEREREEKDQQLSRTKKNISKRRAEVESILMQEIQQDALYEILRLEYKKISEETERSNMIKEQVSRLNPQLNEINLVVIELERQLDALKEEAKAETDEDFYRAYDDDRQRKRYKEQLDDVTIQLELSGCKDSLASLDEVSLKAKEAECEEGLALIEKQSTLLRNEHAKLTHQIEQLRTDETLSEQLQIFEMKKSELAHLAKKWATRKAVAETIHQTMSELKEEKLPSVLKVAEQLFSKLTGGNYEALHVTEAGLFVAVASNGVRYPIVELSQATKEQAYISLRLALAASVFEIAPFPIIMDDPFVHFDEERLSRMIKVLEDATKHQFIYFTCHKKMIAKWDNAKIINVSNIGDKKKEFVQ